MNLSKYYVKPWAQNSEMQLSAREKILKNETIIVERPIVSVAQGDTMRESHVSKMTLLLLKEPKLLLDFSKLNLKTTEFPLDKNDKAATKKLEKIFGVSRTIIRKIFFTVATNNSAYINSSGEIKGLGVYPIISRSNHSCSPNARYYYGDVKNKEAVLVALKDIEVDEPITWSYINNSEFYSLDYKLRNFILLHKFRFNCRCDRCDMESIPE